MPLVQLLTYLNIYMHIQTVYMGCVLYINISQLYTPLLVEIHILYMKIVVLEYLNNDNQIYK